MTYNTIDGFVVRVVVSVDYCNHLKFRGLTDCYRIFIIRSCETCIEMSNDLTHLITVVACHSLPWLRAISRDVSLFLKYRIHSVNGTVSLLE